MPLVNYLNYPFDTDENNRIGVPMHLSFVFDETGYLECVETYQLIIRWSGSNYKVSMLT
jgi:hypothetical protein